MTHRIDVSQHVQFPDAIAVVRRDYPCTDGRRIFTHSEFPSPDRWIEWECDKSEGEHNP